MSISDRKMGSNRANGKKSSGPVDKTRTKLNAIAHGLLAAGITQLDDPERYRKLVRELKGQMNPVGVLETELLEDAILLIVRLTRARRLEAEYITEILNPPKRERDPLGDFVLDLDGPIVDPGIPAALKPVPVQCLVNIYQRYETCFANRLFRTLHELERRQRMRQGEFVSAPIPVDISVHAKTEPPDSTPTAIEQSKTAPVNGKRVAAPVTEDSSHTDKGVMDPAPAESDQQRPSPGDSESLPAPDTGDSNRRPDNEPVDSVPAESQKKALPEWKAGPPSEPIWCRR